MLEVYKSYWVRIIDFKGRSTRLEFWVPILVNYLVLAGIFALLQFLTNNTFAVTNIYSIGQLVLVVLYESLVVSVWLAGFSLRIRRLHDTGLSGKWIIVYFIPLIGIFVFGIMAFLPSRPSGKYMKYNMSKSRWIGIDFLLVLVISFFAIFVKNYANYSLESYRSSQVAKWEADQKPLMSNNDFEALFNRYHKNNNLTTLKLVKGVRQIIIPGLHGAWSINHHTKKLDFGDDWVPQGLAENEKYYFISAYDGEHRLNSLIFMVNKDTGKYYKSIILKRKAHVGGLAIDEKHQLLWVSNDVKNHAEVEGISLKTINEYHASHSKKPINAVQNVPLYWASNTSGLAYFKNNLMIVKYGNHANQHSVVDMETMSQSGLVPRKSERVINWKHYILAYRKGGMNALNSLLVKHGYFKSITSGYVRMQGLAILPTEKNNQATLIFTQSNGNQASNLIITQKTFSKYFDFYQISKLKNINQKVIKVSIPPSAEQVTADSKKRTISILFEGGAKEYRKYKFGLVREPFMDRLVIYEFVNHH